jgi:hypothetical protein
MFTTISTYYTFPKTIEQIRQNMTGHVTSRYQGLNSSEVASYRALTSSCIDYGVRMTDIVYLYFRTVQLSPTSKSVAELVPYLNLIDSRLSLLKQLLNRLLKCTCRTP